MPQKARQEALEKKKDLVWNKVRKSPASNCQQASKPDP